MSLTTTTTEVLRAFSKDDFENLDNISFQEMKIIFTAKIFYELFNSKE